MTGKTVNYTSPNRIKEQAITLPNIPHGKYSKKDAAKLSKFLAIDFYDAKIALCPKTFSDVVLSQWPILANPEHQPSHNGQGYKPTGD